jgi:hypothetical protein
MWLGLGLALASVGAAAQTVTGSGTSGTVPVFTGTSTIGNSSTPIIVTSTGNVGIGTTSPDQKLQVLGTGRFGTGTASWGVAAPVLIDQPGSTEAAILIWQEGIASTLLGNKAGDTNLYLTNDYLGAGLGTPSESVTLTTAGSVGIGTTGPQAVLNIHGNALNTGSGGLMLDASDTGNPANLDYYLSINPFVVASGQIGYQFKTVSSGGGTNVPLTFNATGNVGIGTTAPAYKLDVTGAVRATTGYVFPDGTTQTTAFSATLCGGDYAESVDVTGSRTNYEAGDVLVLDPDNPGKILKAAEPYSTMVSGVFSTKPGLVGRRQLTPKSDTELPMAVVGIVPTKVTTENGSIRVGDLLVSSGTPGYAMKGTDRNRMLGAVIGKAMGPLESGSGVIEVLVTLQ